MDINISIDHLIYKIKSSLINVKYVYIRLVLLMYLTFPKVSGNK